MASRPEQPSVLFVHNARTSFVDIDLRLLRSAFRVTERLESTKRALRPSDIWRAIRSHDIVFCWFASWHSFFPTLFARMQRKPAIVVIGGYDTACVPEAGYGLQRGGLKKWVSRAVICMATHLITNSHAARDEAIRNAWADGRRIKIIYHGLDYQIGEPILNKERLVLTVGNVWSENLLRKGLLPFIEAARALPDVPFVLAGKWQDDSIEELIRIAPPNVTFLGFVTDVELQSLYRRASVYVQASLHEGFGLSVAEAMLAGCIPVVYPSGSLPEVLGGEGIVTTRCSVDVLIEAIRTGLHAGENERQRCSAHIKRQFPLEERRRELISFAWYALHS